MERLSSEALEFRQIHKERRLFNDTATWLAESLNGSMCTEFTYFYVAGDICAEDGGSMEKVFADSIQAAENLPANLGFEWRRRKHEMDEFYEMQIMMERDSFNTMVVVSDYPPELMDSNQSIGGYNGQRKQTMLRIITKTSDNELKIQTQSLDLSDRAGLERMYGVFGIKPAEGELLGQRIHLSLSNKQQDDLMDYLTDTYDQSLGNKFGGQWHAGQRGDSRETFQFVVQQANLIEHYTDQVSKIGENPDLLRAIAATMKYRYENRHNIEHSMNGGYVLDNHSSVSIQQEILQADIRARSSGVTFDGCGMSLGGEPQDIDSQTGLLGYGNKSDQKTSYKFDKKMYCVVCQAPPKTDELKKMCGPCGICKGCDQKLSK